MIYFKKKGVSPVVATTTLIGLTVAITAIVLLFGGEISEELQQKQGINIEKQTQIEFHRVEIPYALKLLVQNPVPSDTYISSLSAVTHYEKNGSEEIFIKTKLKPKISESTDISKIEEYKATCTVLGFELGTDKFADCTLKLFVADNKSNTEIVQSSSGAQEMIIYDPDRERRIKQKRWNDLLHGRCDLNALSKNPC